MYSNSSELWYQFIVVIRLIQRRCAIISPPYKHLRFQKLPTQIGSHYSYNDLHSRIASINLIKKIANRVIPLIGVENCWGSDLGQPSHMIWRCIYVTQRTHSSRHINLKFRSFNGCWMWMRPLFMTVCVCIYIYNLRVCG